MRIQIEWTEDGGKTWGNNGTHEGRTLAELRQRAVELLMSLWSEGCRKASVQMDGARIYPNADEVKAILEVDGDYYTETELALIAVKGDARKLTAQEQVQ